MKRWKNIRHLSSLTVLFTAVAALLFVNFPDASSMPGPDRFWLGQVLQDDKQVVEVRGLATFFPHIGSIWITEPGITVTFPTTQTPAGAFAIHVLSPLQVLVRYGNYEIQLLVKLHFGEYQPLLMV